MGRKRKEQDAVEKRAVASTAEWAVALASMAAVVVGLAAWIRLEEAFLEPLAPPLAGLVVALAAGLALLRSPALRRRLKWAPPLVFAGLWGASTALVVWLDVALDWHAPVERRCRVLGVEARSTGWRRSSAPGVRYFATVDGLRREPTTLRVAGPPTRDEKGERARLLDVTTQDGAFGMAHVVASRYAFPEEGPSPLQSLLAALGRRRAEHPDDVVAARILARLEGLRAPDAVDRRAAAADLHVQLAVLRPSPDPERRAIAELLQTLLGQAPGP